MKSKCEILERRIVDLEVKLLNTLDLLETIVNMNRGFSNETTEYLLEEISKLM
jgi:hypothetical protein